MTHHHASASHDDWEIGLLQADRELAIEYLKIAMNALQTNEERGAALLAIRAVAEACGGLGLVASEAGVSRETLYRTLSAKGNPTLKTLAAVLKTLGLRLSIERDETAARA